MSQNEPLNLADELIKSADVDPVIEGQDLTKRSIKELIAMGIEIRDDYSAETKKYKKYKADVDDTMRRISQALKIKGDELGVDSFKTDEGTAYRNMKESYRVGVWDEILGYIKESGNWQMLEKRVAKLATREIHKVTGKLPPGVEYVVEEEFVIRRPNEKGTKSDE